MPVLIAIILQKDNHGGPDNPEEGLFGYTAITPSSGVFRQTHQATSASLPTILRNRRTQARRTNVWMTERVQVSDSVSYSWR